MKLYCFRVIACVLGLCALRAFPTASAQSQPPADGSERIRALLLRAAGWTADWSLPGGNDYGESEFLFEARGEKLVGKLRVISIRNVERNVVCERDVTITSDEVKFNGCLDSDITLRYNPHDQAYPFKGKSGWDYEYKVRAK